MLFFFVSLQSLFVIYILIRQSNIHSELTFFKGKKLTKIGILIFAFHFINLLLFYKIQSKTTYYVMLFLPNLIVLSSRIIIAKTLESRFRKDFYHYLIAVTLSMKVGLPFRKAIRDSLHVFNQRDKNKVVVIIESVVFSQHRNLDLHSRFEQDIYNEFKKIDQMTHKSLYRLSLWVQKLERSFEFRHKSGQILSQLYIQAGILLCMYTALMIFVIKTYGFETNLKVIFISFVLFLMGIVSSFKIGKSVKWKF